MTNTQIKDQIQFAGFNPVFFGCARVTYLFNIMCCVLCFGVVFVFVQCLVYPMLPGFVCLRSVSCVPNVASFSGLSILTALRFSPKRVFKAGKYQYSLINLLIFVFFLVCSILLVSLDCSLLIAPSISLTFIDDILTLISNDIR